MRYLISVLLIAVLTGCETVHHHYPRPGPPPHARARGRRVQHVYHYYPDVEIYWCRDLGTYTVFRGGQWVVVNRRPARLTSGHRHVVIRPGNNRPWRNHTRYMKKFPPKQLARQQPGRGKGKQLGAPAKGGGKGKQARPQAKGLGGGGKGKQARPQAKGLGGGGQRK